MAGSLASVWQIRLGRAECAEDDGQGTAVVKWVGTVGHGPLTLKIAWTEREVWNESERRCDFKLVEGDMKRWRSCRASGGTAGSAGP
jgi:hypothetical protein